MEDRQLDPDHALYGISVAAELTGVNPQMLRAYETKGLIRPYRTDGGTRRYSGRDLAMPVDGITGATRAPGVHPLPLGRHTAFAAMEAGEYRLVIAAREVGGCCREA